MAFAGVGERLVSPAQPEPRDFGFIDDRRAFAFELAVNDLGGVRVFTRQDLSDVVDDCDLTAEAKKRLRQLAANRAAADHDQAPWQLGQLEDGFVSEVASLFQTRNGQFQRATAGGDHGAVEFQAFAVNFNLVRSVSLKMVSLVK